MILREYLYADGSSPFADWFDRLDVPAATRVTVALERLSQGNRSSVKSVNQGVLEYRIDFGPGYRIYFGQEGDELILLLTGGTKKKQSQDIARAHELWQDYKLRRKLLPRDPQAPTKGNKAWH